MSKIEQLKDYLKPKKDIWLYEDGDEITQEEIELMRNATTKQKMNLFKKNENYDKDRKPYKYNVIYTCTQCGKEVIEPWSKTNILDKNYHLVCYKCREKNENNLIFKRKIEELEYEKKKIENTKQYIIDYLDSDKCWKNDVPQWRKWQNISAYCVDRKIIAEHIMKMDYYDFLKTPYWNAVSGQVKKKNDYKCQLCGNQGTLNVHHPDYSFHGYEAENINKLLCLCDKCHNNYHKITEKK